MPAIKGTFDGTKYADLRLIHLSPGMQAWYKKVGQWDKITGVRSGEHWVSVRLGKVKHTWRFEDYIGRLRWVGHVTSNWASRENCFIGAI